MRVSQHSAAWKAAAAMNHILGTPEYVQICEDRAAFPFQPRTWLSYVLHKQKKQYVGKYFNGRTKAARKL